MAEEKPLMLLKLPLQRLLVIFAASITRAVRLFEAMDEEGDGTILRAAFRRALPELHISATKQEADALFDELDVSGQGELVIADLERTVLRKGASCPPHPPAAPPAQAGTASTDPSTSRPST